MKTKHVNYDFKIVELNLPKGFSFNKKNHKITLYDKELIASVIDKNFNRKYRDLLMLVIDVNTSDDSTESDGNLALMKINELKELLINKYYYFLPKNILQKYIKMLVLLEQKLIIPKKNKRR